MKQIIFMQKIMEMSVIGGLILFFGFILWKLSLNKQQILHEQEQREVDVELRNRILSPSIHTGNHHREIMESSNR